MRWGLLLLLACSSSTTNVNVTNVSVNNNVDVQWGAEGRDDSINFQDARLQRGCFSRSRRWLGTRSTSISTWR